MGPAPQQPTLSPEQLRLQGQAETDRIDGIRDRVSDETRQILQRFGSSRSMAGVTSGGLSGGPSNLQVAGSLGLFGGRKFPLISGKI